MVEHVGLLAAIIGVVIMWLTYRRKKEVRVLEPNPVRVRKVEPNVKEPMCLERRGMLQAQLNTLDGYTRNEVGRLHDKIDEVEARFDKNLRESMGTVNATLRTMPTEIVRLINEASAVKSQPQS